MIVVSFVWNVEDFVKYVSAESEISFIKDQYTVKDVYAIPTEEIGVDFVPRMVGNVDEIVVVGADDCIGELYVNVNAF